MIRKRKYELSVWSETLGDNGQKIEKKEYIIGAHDMSYLGRATGIKLETKLNGTHTLTFQMPDKYFDSLSGEFVENEFIDSLFNERKIKLHYKGNWYEFYIKNVSEAKHLNSYMKTYTCKDAFIDELSRNGYGIIFDTELYNNVEEVGTFTTEILEDSIWEYAPEHNWGDFTEYLEEKLFKIPVGKDLFLNLVGHKLNYVIDSPRNGEQIINAFNHKKRPLELGDDLAAARNGKGGYFWDAQDGSMPLLSESIDNIPNDGYIYIPYSQLQFCYKTTSEGGTVIAATEEVQYYDDKSYAVAPLSVDPTALIQFIAIPKGAKIEVDEAGLIVNKDYTYVMTVQEWNKNVNSNYYYQQYPANKDGGKDFRHHVGSLTYEEAALGNKAAYYEGYLDKIGNEDVVYGKKISISDRTEVNITDEINQYVTVYNNDYKDYEGLYVNPDGLWKDTEDDINYRVCSKIETRQVVPQLARNLIQNGNKFKSATGWEAQMVYNGADASFYNNLQFRVESWESEQKKDYMTAPLDTILRVFPCCNAVDNNMPPDGGPFNPYNTIINFGITGQEKEITCDKIYCLGLKIGLPCNVNDELAELPNLNDFYIRIGEGRVLTQGDYEIDDVIIIPVTDIVPALSKSQYITINGKDEIDLQDKEINICYTEGYIFIKPTENIKNPYFAITQALNAKEYYIFDCELFEAYTKGIDQFDATDEITPAYRYSGRDLFDSVLKNDGIGVRVSNKMTSNEVHSQVIFEEDVMSGDTFEYRHYFIQQVAAYQSSYESGQRSSSAAIADTFAQKELLDDHGDIIAFQSGNFAHNELPFSAAQFTDDDLEIATKYIDLNKCHHYNSGAASDEGDCSYEGEHICLYQKYGYCPYLFQTEKHCRKIRTLNGEKSNRFNLTQELGKTFEMYPMYWIDHKENGKATDKKLFYITEKGIENKLGFRYQQNLSNISRTLNSDQIITKLYVEDVDSSLSKTGLCSIKAAEDNPSKDSFIINFDYYIVKGILDKNKVEADLYGAGQNDMGYLKKLGHLNTEYDKLSNAIINLQTSSFNELNANIQINLSGIEAAQQELYKIKGYIDKYRAKVNAHGNLDYNEIQKLNDENQTYQNYITKYNQQLYILDNLIYETFFDPITNEYLDIADENNLIPQPGDRGAAASFFDEKDISWMKESSWIKQHTYSLGMLGQFNREFLQISEWKKQQARLLKQISDLSSAFFKKYEPYLKEGTWSNSNYLSDNAYYFGAVNAAAQGALPKTNYSINVIDIYLIPGYEDYEFNIADTTYVEDEGMFGRNPKTGLPNRLKVIISGIIEDLDVPTNDSIQVQNYTTQFEDLFQQITGAVQSLTFNENIYKRSSNFTSNQNIKQDSLQGALDQNDLTLLNTDETNISIDNTGQSGSDLNNHNNKYKLNGQGMVFSNNGGQSWKMGVGPGGINADFINAGSIDAGKIRIVDNNYLYFLWDKSGINAFRNPKEATGNITFDDYTQFNRFGLSIAEKGRIRLRAGYAFNGVIGGEDGGKMSTETTQGKNIGFYLYNNSGQTIFSTNVPSADDVDDEQNMTARLSLVGEMHVTNDVESTSVTGNQYKYNDSYEYVLVNCPMLNTPLSGIDAIDFNNNYPIADDDTFEDIANDIAYNYLVGNIPTSHDWDTDPLIVEQQGLLYTVKLTNVIDSTINYHFEGGDTTVLHTDNINTTVVTINVSYTFNEEEVTVNANSQLLCKNGSSIYIPDSSEQIKYCPISKQGKSTIYRASPISMKEVSMFVEDANSTTITETTFSKTYYDENNASIIYLTEDIIEGESKLKEGRVGLYINNKIAWQQNKTQSAHERLFCCAVNNDTDPVQNIFTIKKNGSLYMGGKIKDINNNELINSANIPDSVMIDRKDADIAIEDGIMYINFNRIKDPETTKTLVQAIADAVSSVRLIQHKHQINQIKGKFTDSGTHAYLPSKEDLNKFNGYLNNAHTYSIKDYLKDNPLAFLTLFVEGTLSVKHTDNPQIRTVLTFSNKVLVTDEEYLMNCVSSYTEDAGSAQEGGGSGSADFENWGFPDIID